MKTGLRSEEAYGLHVGDIDLSANKIRIERAVSLGRMKDTKTHERQYIDLSDGLVSLLTEYVDFVKAEALAGNLSEPCWLFPGREGGPVTEADERWHRDLFKQVVSAAQLPGFVPYNLRHTFASLLLIRQRAPSLCVQATRPRQGYDHTRSLRQMAAERRTALREFVGYATRETWHQVDIIE